MRCEQCKEEYAFPAGDNFSPRSETGGRAICTNCSANATDEDKARWLEPRVSKAVPLQETPVGATPRNPVASILLFIVWLVVGFIASCFLCFLGLRVALEGGGSGGGVIVGLILTCGGLLVGLGVARSLRMNGDTASASGLVVGISLPPLLVGACFATLSGVSFR